MRVLHLTIILAIIAAVGLVALAFFDSSPIPALNEMVWNMKGYGLAKTPDEALDRFKKAMEARNYKAAARYLDGDYQVQFKKVAKTSQRMAEAVDNFRHAGNDRSYISDDVDKLIVDYHLEPFPKTITVKEVKQSESGDTAVALITTEITSKRVPPSLAQVQLKKKEDIWRIELPLTEVERAHFDWIERYGQDYVNRLDVVKNEMKTDATTKENVHSALKVQLEQVQKLDQVKRH